MRNQISQQDQVGDATSHELVSLPLGWCWANVAEVGAIKLGRQRSPAHHHGTHMRPYLRVANVFEDRIDLTDVLEMNFTPAEFEQYQLRYGDILLNEGQSLQWVGRSAMYRDELPGSCFQNTLIRFRAYECVTSKFALLVFRYYLHSHRFQRIANWTVNIAHLGASRFAQVEFPVPPLPEQNRIVAKIEELFSDLDAGVAALQRAKANLKRYRAAVLKAAVEGKLTEEWRAKHPNTEPASKLLARTLTERGEKWGTDQLAKFAATGREPPKEWREKYVEPTLPDTTGLEELPDGWTWVSIDQIAECLDNRRIPVNKDERAKRTGDVPYYGANGLVGYIDDFIFDEPLVLVVEDETFVGREKPFSYLINGKAWVNNHAHILRSTTATTTEFLNYALMFYPFIPMTTGTTARRKLTKQRLLEAPFALPPYAEQIEIVQAIELRLSNVDYNDIAITASLVRADRLRQSILKQAFEGKLVPQDLKDEPANVLLERLQVNRSAQEAGCGKVVNVARTASRRAKSRQLQGRTDE